MRTLLPDSIGSMLRSILRRLDKLERIRPVITATPPATIEYVDNTIVIDAGNPMTTPGDIIFEDFTPKPARLPIGTAGQVLTVTEGTVVNESATGNLNIVPTGAGRNDEHIVSGMDLQFSEGVPSTVLVYWNFWSSADGFAQPKSYRIRLRRTDLTGAILWDHFFPGTADNAGGHVNQSEYSYLDDAPTDGHYVMTIQADPGAMFDQAFWSDTRTMLIGAAGGAEALQTDFQTVTSDRTEILLPGMDITAALLSTLYVGAHIKYSTETGEATSTFRIRRTSISGAIVASVVLVNGLASGDGLDDLAELNFVDTAPTDGHYVATVEATAGSVHTYSAYRHLWAQGVSGRLPAWKDDVDDFLVDPTTTEGDMLYRHSGAVARLPVGGSGTVLHGGTDPAYSAVVEGDLSLSDVTTANVSTSKHGLAPKLPNDATKYLDGTGAYTAPPGDQVPRYRQLLMQDGVSGPPVPLETEDGTDWIYSDSIFN